MAKHDIIVIGASAGGINALETVCSGFNADLPAAVFIVLHIGPIGPSYLPQILQRHCALVVDHAVDGRPIEHGHVYVAPPNHHLIVEHGHVHLSLAPRENRTRPAINPLFRSAAAAYGPRVTGVILSGYLDDGTAGLWEIKRRGGIAVVQAREDAEHSQMPENAIANVSVDYQAHTRDIAALLTGLASQDSGSAEKTVEKVMASPTRLTCPDCHGPIERIQLGATVEFKCRVGHTFGPKSMLDAHEDWEERALWSAIESLEEGADLAEELNSYESEPSSLKRNAAAKRVLARAIRQAVVAKTPTT